jgi:tripartite motif-containing protein 71
MRELLSRLCQRIDYFQARRCVYQRRDIFTDAGHITAIGPFARPFDINVDHQGRIYVTEFAGHRVVRLSRDLAFDGWLGGSVSGWQISRRGAKAGTGDNGFNRPHSVSVDADGRLFVTDLDNRRIQIYSPEGTYCRTIGQGVLHGPASTHVTATGDILVCDAIAGAVFRFSAEGVLLRRLEGFNQPHSLFELSDGALLVADTWNHRIVRVAKDDARTVFAGKSEAGPDDNTVQAPVNIGPDGTGGFIVAEFSSHRIHRFDASGTSLCSFGAARPGGDPGIPTVCASPTAIFSSPIPKTTGYRLFTGQYH